MKRKILITFIFFIFGMGVPVQAQVQSNIVTSASTTVRLIPENNQIKPGQVFYMAVLMDLEQEWHVYWLNPGDSGLPPKMEWTLPSGFEAGDIQWPIPEKIKVTGLTSYGYNKRAVLRIPFHTESAELNNSTYSISADLKWLACRIECVPGMATLSLNLSVGDVQQNNPSYDSLMKSYLQLNSYPPEKEGEYQFDWEGEDMVVDIFPPQGITVGEDIVYYPFHEKLIDHHALQKIDLSEDDRIKIYLKKSPIYSEDIKNKGGLLSYLENGKRKGFYVTEERPRRSVISGASSGGFWAALLFAFLGGLILNLMPCVLPVLSIKIMSLVQQSAEDKAKIWKHGVLYTLGILASFWILAIGLILLKTAGKQIGWGFQFQSSVFVLSMMVLFLVMAFNLFGFFEIGTSLTRVQSGRNPFINGILATIVATPCTAPFMGSALGYALTQPAAVGLLIFTALGFGLASPFLLLSANPSWLKFIPKPGPWMVQLKRFFGILFLLTAFWLGWVFWMQQSGASSKAVATDGMAWQKYSPQLLAELKQTDQPIFLDFTASWCLSCQVNDRVALSNKEVINEFKKYNVAMVKADWTNYDESVSRALESFGRNSIPLYVLYSSDKGKDPMILPELITPKIVIDYLNKL